MAWTKTSESEKQIEFKRTPAPDNKVLEMLVQREKKELSVLFVLTPEAYQALYTQIESHPEFGFAEKHGAFMTENGYKCAVTVKEAEEKDVLARFLGFAIGFDQGINEVVADLSNFFRFLDVKAVHEEIARRLESEGIESALNAARFFYEEGTRDVFVLLAKTCIEKNLLDEAKTVLKQIPEEDYPEQFGAAKLLLTLKEDREALEHLFKAGNDPAVQEIRDRIFWQVANKAAGVDSEEVLVRGIRLNDPRTIIAINKKKQELKDETEKFISEKARLEASLKEIQSKLSAFPKAKT